MGAKVTFDSTTRTIKPLGPALDSGIIQLDVQTDFYSDGKEDWLVDANLNKFRFPVEAIGGQPIPGGTLGTTYILVNGWKVDPNLSVTYVVPGTQDGSLPIYGVGGLNEKLKSGPFVFDHRSIIPWSRMVIRKVGNPTDALTVRLEDVGMALYAEDTVAGEQISTVFESHFIAYEAAALIPYGSSLHFHIARTGPRDETNYYEVAYANNAFALTTLTIVVNNGVDDSPLNVIMLGTLQIDVPYTLNLVGNIFTSTGDPVSLPVNNVSLQQQVSTLVEVRTDESAAADMSLLRKITTNKLTTDPTTGILTIYDDDDTTVVKEWYIFEDVAETQTYQGQGIEVRKPKP